MGESDDVWGPLIPIPTQETCLKLKWSRRYNSWESNEIKHKRCQDMQLLKMMIPGKMHPMPSGRLNLKDDNFLDLEAMNECVNECYGKFPTVGHIYRLSIELIKKNKLYWLTTFTLQISLQGSHSDYCIYMDRHWIRKIQQWKSEKSASGLTWEGGIKGRSL